MRFGGSSSIDNGVSRASSVLSTKEGWGGGSVDEVQEGEKGWDIDELDHPG